MVKLPLLAGEIELENGKMATGTIVLTDYRLLLCFSDDHNLSLPIGLIDEVVKNYQSLNIYTKQARLIVCTFETIQDCHYWSKRITEAMGELCKLENLFTFKYFSALESSSNHHQKQQQQQQQEQQQQQQQPPQPPQQQQPVSQENQRQEEQEESKIEEHIHNHNEVREKVENGDDEKKHMSKLKPNYSLNPVNIEDSLIYHEFKRLKFNEDPWNNEVDDADNKECVEEEEEDEEIENDRRIARQCANDTGNDFRDPDRPALWRISEANINFEVCSSYPRFLIVPADIKDEDLATVAKFRYQNRVPAIVWRSVKNGCIIARSSQPYVGWWGSRCDMDEKLLQSIVKNTMKHSSNNGAPTTTSTTASTTATATATLNPDSVSETRTEGETVSASGGTEEASDEQQQQPSNSSGGAADCCKKLLVVDARSYAAAMINRAKGGGVECAEYYSCCEVQFMGLANIHSIRKSFNAIRYLCEYSSDSENWNTFLTNSKWLIHISSLLKSAMIIVDAIKDNRSVLVHCSDGWDRTPQIVSLAELMLDPFYRTWDGFRILIDKEWCEFGHKFADRCGISSEIDDPYERCPVFLQWLDCVHQIVNQLENHFEFNVQLLETLLLHTYSCLYGTFLCNSVNERVTKQIYLKTPSIWSHLSSNKERFINKNFSPPTKGDDYIVTPSPEVKDLRLWTEVFAPSTNDVIKSGNLDLIN